MYEQMLGIKTAQTLSQKCKKKTLNPANYINFAFFFSVSIIITIIFFFHMLGLWRHSRFNTYQHVEKTDIVTQVYHLSVYNKSLRCVYMCIIIYYICIIHTYICVYMCVLYVHMYICHICHQASTNFTT